LPVWARQRNVKRGRRGEGRALPGITPLMKGREYRVKVNIMEIREISWP
jgi:hypothetical protein